MTSWRQLTFAWIYVQLLVAGMSRCEQLAPVPPLRSLNGGPSLAPSTHDAALPCRLQVAAKYMPMGSTIIGLDLDPIKPIRGVKAFVEDITTAKCRATLKRELAGKSVDVVLHDGAPNVGAAWSKDAYGQVRPPRVPPLVPARLRCPPLTDPDFTAVAPCLSPS